MPDNMRHRSPLKTQEMAEERVKDKTVECKDWYFCKKSL